MTVEDLPLIDEHALTIARPRQQVWTALEAFVHRSLLSAADGAMARLLGTDPPGGFAVDDVVTGERLDLAGRHRFSVYRLVFRLADAPLADAPLAEVPAADAPATRLSARSYAVFPGVRGAVYETMVIRTRFHVLATRRMLRQVRRISLSDPAG
ncbi:hypothetical protein KV097_08250 [Mumia sp. zg.B17]|uniref:hypothetical protein n=1 Tax=unclassified Mumia TaxID=2621872 RepID=UPI001C6ECC42|nr:MULTISPECIES: hypothetical protein [unclassified Mumia]MBW9205936.1 hypothetical protein [Mumia sp. zg.B17]MDD9347699.1 hypothetical protein [Mumia sp.]